MLNLAVPFKLRSFCMKTTHRFEPSLKQIPISAFTIKLVAFYPRAGKFINGSLIDGSYRSEPSMVEYFRDSNDNSDWLSTFEYGRKIKNIYKKNTSDKLAPIFKRWICM